MFRKEKQPKSINFLEAVYASSDFLDNAYIWLVTIGKYLLIVVQIIALGVFFSRFILDRRNNDLTEEINSKVVLLSNESWRRNAILFDNYQILFSDVKAIKDGQDINSREISELLSGVPRNLDLESFSYRDGSVSIRISSLNLNDVKNYESALKNNPDYEDVRFSITKEQGLLSVGVSFNLSSSN